MEIKGEQFNRLLDEVKNYDAERLHDSKVTKILTDALETHNKRRGIYGKGYQRCGKVMMAMFPNGFQIDTEDDFARFALLNMIVAKLCRYTHNWNTGGHKDSIHDLGVYSFILEECDAEIAEKKNT
jgi:hypothetical protein